MNLGDSDPVVLPQIAQTNDCPSIHCFLRRQRRLVLQTNQPGEGGLESNAIAESDIPLINVRDSVLDRIAGLPGSFRATNIAPPAVVSVTPAKNVHQTNGPAAGAIVETPQKRVSFAALPTPTREHATTGNGHLSGLTDISFALDTPPRTPNRATGICLLFTV